ncbi:HutD/Ves family protein [Paracoccus albus]|uniref:HutD/Ves family protein n=1 Tax=Paracoccus albus TaxID=3017784 RepID=UPI0022F09EE6|nr:HutD family protein [Paracoccus albus]WBU60822.1 HutD family protein [Paracoccus albus]
MTGLTKVYRAADRRFTAWKNGGGKTAEVVCHPPGAGFDDFDWRISTARVDRSGPFSALPGVDRCLTVVCGGSLVLDAAGGSVRLDASSAPFRFSGDDGCHCTLIGPPVMNLNVMVRAPFRCVVRRGSLENSNRRPTDLDFIFATRDLPQIGLCAHDLARLTGAKALPDDIADAIFIRIQG